MRDLLFKRARAILGRCAKDLLTLAVSAFSPEVLSVDSDRRVHDPLPQVQRGAGRGLHRDGERGVSVADTCDVDRTDSEQPSQEAHPRRAEGERAPGLVEPVVDRDLKPDNDPLDLATGIAGMSAAVDSMLGPPTHQPPPPQVDRDIKPSNMPRKFVCSKCGYVGGNARGCGRSHPTRITTVEQATTLGGAGSDIEGFAKFQFGRQDQPMTAIAVAPARNLRPTPAAVEVARQRIKDRSARVAAKDSERHATPRVEVDENPTARERWSKSEIAVETKVAEDAKHIAAALPAPSSSWEIANAKSNEYGHGLAVVERLA